MKWLKKVRLINWHYFHDEIIEFGKQTAFVGGSGAGKSTIIDALQVIFIANHQQIKFNSAAHDETKRSMSNYLRGKIGTDQKTFLREGNFTTYLLSEFHDDKTKENFVVGAIIDVFEDSANDTEEFFILANRTIEEVEVVSPTGFLRNIEQFKRQFPANRTQALFEKNKKNYQKALLNRFGQVSPRFFPTFLKALSFKPITDVRNFVYDYILDKNELQLDVLKDNFRTYERMQQELTSLEERKGQLGEIANSYEQFRRLAATAMEQEFVVMKFEKLLKEEVLAQKRQIHDSRKEELRLLKENSEALTVERVSAEEAVKRAWISWQQNASELKKTALEEQIYSLKQSAKQMRREMDMLGDDFREEYEQIGEVADWPGTSMWSIPAPIGNVLQENKLTLARLSKHFIDGEPIEKEALTIFHDELTFIEQSIHELYAEIIRQSTRAEEAKAKTAELIMDLEETIRKLEQRRRTYPVGVERLKTRLEIGLGEGIPVYIFCEEMEISDERWRNAIEGYLNTQRFDLLVEPLYFQQALAIYEKDKFQYNIEGVGLVDTDKQKRMKMVAEAGSLASSLQSDNKLAENHVNYLLGKVMKAEDEKQLRMHKTAVTPSCMVYNRLTARQMPADRYAVPFIGSLAIVRQLELKREELAQAMVDQDLYIKVIKDFKRLDERIKDFQLRYGRFKECLEMPAAYEIIMNEIAEAARALASLDLSEAERLHGKYLELIEIEKKLGERLLSIAEKIGTLGAELKREAGEIFSLNQEAGDQKEKIESWKSGPGMLFIQGAEKRWEEARRQNADTSKKLADFNSSRKGMISRKEERWKELVNQRTAYNRTNDFIEDPYGEGNEAYQEALSKIENVNIPHYEKRLEISLQNAENEFKAHCVFKLKEAIQFAKSEFESLDYALKNLPFSKERYKFEVKPSSTYKRFYDVIMDPVLVEKGLFSDVEDEEKNTVLHELFEILATGNEQELEEFTDYRRYLDFDLRITFADGATQSLSSILKEKSGGETQTPFYIAILASFHHLYKGNNTVRLVVFDEAFNKMDEKNIKSSLQLVRKLNLQLIAAVPDEKMPQMFQEVTTTLIVTNQNNRCYVDMLDRDVDFSLMDEGQMKNEQVSLF